MEVDDNEALMYEATLLQGNCNGSHKTHGYMTPITKSFLFTQIKGKTIQYV